MLTTETFILVIQTKFFFLITTFLFSMTYFIYKEKLNISCLAFGLRNILLNTSLANSDDMLLRKSWHFVYDPIQTIHEANTFLAVADDLSPGKSIKKS